MKIKIKFSRSDGQWYEYDIDDYEIIEEVKKIDMIKIEKASTAEYIDLMLDKMDELVIAVNLLMEDYKLRQKNQGQ